MAISQFLASCKAIFKDKRSGFTLIEIVVTLGVIVIMSTILVGYSRQSGRQLLLTSTEAKVLNLFARAKFLSIQTFFQEPTTSPGGSWKVCGYGVHVSKITQTMFIFADRVAVAVNCPGNNTYTLWPDLILTGELDIIELDTDIMSIVDSETNLRNIVYIPPDPETRINGNPGDASAELQIELNDGSRSFEIVVDDKGQIRAN